MNFAKFYFLSSIAFATFELARLQYFDSAASMLRCNAQVLLPWAAWIPITVIASGFFMSELGTSGRRFLLSPAAFVINLLFSVVVSSLPHTAEQLRVQVSLEALFALTQVVLNLWLFKIFNYQEKFAQGALTQVYDTSGTRLPRPKRHHVLKGFISHLDREGRGERGARTRFQRASNDQDANIRVG